MILNKWLTIEYIEEQENTVAHEFHSFFGKGKGGFCDFALDGCELILQAICHMTDGWKLNEKGDFKDFDNAFRCFAFYHYDRIFYTFKSCYNLLISGYYTDASILLRSIVETFVRLKFIEKEKTTDLIMKALSGKERFPYSYKQQFDAISLGYYEFYRLLCNMAHGGMASHILKVTPNSETKEMIPDNGIIFKANQASFITNQFVIYLLGHLNFLYYVFDEIPVKMPNEYKIKLAETIKWLNICIEEYGKNEKNKIWLDKAVGIIND